MSAGLTVDDVARLVAASIPDGSCVNLGIGLPLLVASHVPEDREFVFHSENGILGVGPRPGPGDEDWDLIDAGKNPVTMVAGGSFVSHVDSFCIVRGGYIDVAVMGAYQVSGRGDLANWWRGDGIPGVGGAIDLASRAKQVVVMMRHNEPGGNPKIVESCNLPLTGSGVVSHIFTELGVFSPVAGHLVVEAIAEGISDEELRERTGVPVTRPARVRCVAGGKAP